MLGLEDLVNLSGGSELTNLKKRASAKHISYNFFNNMLHHCEIENEKSFQNALKCSDELRLNEYNTNGKKKEKISSKFCKNRLCVICNRIRSAQHQDKYLPIIKEWDSYFLTLTRRNVPYKELEKTICDMYEFFRLFRYQNRKLKIKLIRKLECTYNAERNDYHPHYHIIIQGYDNAKKLLQMWLNRYPEVTSYLGQDIRKTNMNSLKELFKYFTKLYSPPKDVKTEDFFVNYKAVENMYNAIRGKRIFQSVGFTLPKIDDITEETTKQMISSAFYIPSLKDWVDEETGEIITNYKPSLKTTNFINKLTFST